MAKHVDYYVSLNSPWTYLGVEAARGDGRRNTTRT